MHFQVFVPNAPDLAKSLVDVGLSDLATNFDTQRVEVGPGGAGGTLFAWMSPQTREIGYYPARQTWIPAAGGDLPAGRYHVGIWNESPPTQADMRRPYPHAGTEVALGDGAEWLIPEARELPHDAILADDGSLKFEIQRQFHAYGLECQRWAKVVRGIREDEPGSDEADFDELWKFALHALRLNYRITPEVVSHLRLFTTVNLPKPMLAAIGALQLARG